VLGLSRWCVEWVWIVAFACWLAFFSLLALVHN
jgi:hypothetical protein